MNSIEKKWREILDHIYCDGKLNRKDDSVVKEILGYHTFIENPLKSLEFLKLSSDDFIKYIKDGYFDVNGYVMNNQGIAEYLEGFFDDKIVKCYESDKGFVYTYPERLLSMRTWNKSKVKKYARIEEVLEPINQIDVIVDRLKNHIGSNRAVATLYNCGLDKDEEDIPCLNWIQATVRDNILRLHVTFRSNDIFGAWPANMFFITYIGLLICERLEDEYPTLVFDGIDYHVSSAHYYITDEDMVKKVIEGI